VDAGLLPAEAEAAEPLPVKAVVAEDVVAVACLKLLLLKPPKLQTLPRSPRSSKEEEEDDSDPKDLTAKLRRSMSV